MRQFPDYRADKPGITERKELSIMLIYIEMYPKDRLLNGPKCSVSELKKRLAKILAEAETKDFISIILKKCLLIMCRLMKILKLTIIWT